jgi:hypothetical protein
MKALRLIILVILISVATFASAQSESKNSFEKLKSLAGSWEGRATSNEPGFSADSVRVSLRVTSMGNALLHEMTAPGQKEDPISMLYLDGDRLLLTHYCDMGNRPRMEGKMAPDGKMLKFDFVDVAGDIKPGHMHDVTFTFVDANHHVEDWTFILPGGKFRARIDLQRMK